MAPLQIFILKSILLEDLLQENYNYTVRRFTLAENDLSKFWGIDKEIVFLNHGSFGATPIPVLEKQREIQKLMEKEPVKFFMRDYESFYDNSIAALAALVGAGKNDLAFVPNATTAVNTALKAMPLSKGDEILVTNQEYNACRNALDEISKEKGVTVKEISLPFPVKSSEEIVEAIVNFVSTKTRALLLDHIVSQTALLLDVKTIVKEMKERNVETIVDGAHSVGMIPLNIEEIGCAFYTSNCHKWLCAPKGSAFLYAREDLQKMTRPLAISHGANSLRTDRSRFFLEFSWIGTDDPSPYFSIPFTIEFLNSLLPGGIATLMQKNRSLCLEARNLILNKLQIEKPCPDDMVGAMAAFPIKDADKEPAPPMFIDELQNELFYRFNIEIPVMHWPIFPKRLLRISCQAYNSIEDYRKLCGALEELGI
jgi:isopenicillin-N epimerase